MPGGLLVFFYSEVIFCCVALLRGSDISYFVSCYFDLGASDVPIIYLFLSFCSKLISFKQGMIKF